MQVGVADDVTDIRAQDVEHADQEEHVDNGFAGGFPIRCGVEAHQDVRQAGSSEHEGQQQGKGVLEVGQPVGRTGIGRAVKDLAGLRVGTLEGGDECHHVGVGISFDHEGDEGEQEHGTEQDPELDQLVDGGGLHAAHGDVGGDDQRDDDDGFFIAYVQEQSHDLARAEHLRSHVEERDEEHAHHAENARALGVESFGNEVGHGVASELSERTCQEQEQGDIAHKESQGIDDAVESEEEGHAGDTQERGCGQVVRGDGRGVDEGIDLAPGQVIIGRGFLFTEHERGDDGKGQHTSYEDQGHDGYLISGFHGYLPPRTFVISSSRALALPTYQMKSTQVIG